MINALVGLPLPIQEQRLNGFMITGEPAHHRVPGPRGRGYVINLASNKNGIGYGPWTHIEGWSEAVVEYIRALEQMPQAKGKRDRRRRRFPNRVRHP